MVIIKVEGAPCPAGSKTAFAIRKGGVLTGKVAVVDANRNSREWKNTVAAAARKQYTGKLLEFALRVKFAFRMQRPKGHSNTKGLRPDAPEFHIIRPDVTKLIRAAEDALTGIVWEDDAQIVQQAASKDYCLEGENPGVTIFISPAVSHTRADPEEEKGAEPEKKDSKTPELDEFLNKGKGKTLIDIINEQIKREELARRMPVAPRSPEPKASPWTTWPASYPGWGSPFTTIVGETEKISDEMLEAILGPCVTAKAGKNSPA